MADEPWRSWCYSETRRLWFNRMNAVMCAVFLGVGVFVLFGDHPIFGTIWVALMLGMLGRFVYLGWFAPKQTSHEEPDAD
ncbi:hypothetical protein [Aeromicrobium terrae]|uniref:Uncharacterized protein n=1 Tax=Aeromicrobium terrae TaxID=2498846 RepID=A0A5C8NJ32_9ACTN|nr:hypothetical protein [Aeromicrobium terrae]TXL60791.1 hypothetical protein FHP06_10225 [Aeromicrobium terrae]